MRPSEEFTINVLSPEDYRLLPYPLAKESYGMSIMDRKVAYVMRTGWDEFDQATIDHEFDELMAAQSDHEINGIRYKSGKNLIIDILTGGVSTGMRALEKSKQNKARKEQTRLQDVFNQNLQRTEDMWSRVNQSPVSQAFAPQTKAPMSAEAFQTGLGNLTKNTERQRQDVFSTFRGLGTPGQNTAFSKALGNVKTSGEAATSAFTADQDERKRIAGVF